MWIFGKHQKNLALQPMKKFRITQRDLLSEIHRMACMHKLLCLVSFFCVQGMCRYGVYAYMTLPSNRLVTVFTAFSFASSCISYLFSPPCFLSIQHHTSYTCINTFSSIVNAINSFCYCKLRRLNIV